MQSGMYELHYANFYMHVCMHICHVAWSNSDCQIQSNLANSQTAVQDNFAKIMSAYEDRTLSVWLEVAEQFGVTREAAARFTST